MDGDRSKNVTKLRTACQDAYSKFPNSCSTAAWYVIQQFKPDQPFMNANDLLTTIASSPEWQELPLAEVSQTANAGGVVVGGLQEPNHGHVVIAFPADEKPDGGFIYYNKNTGEPIEAVATGIFPRIMSTSMGSWPGAKSNGDKTARDPWPAQKFKQVRFWKLVYAGQRPVSNPSERNPRWEKDRVTRPIYHEDVKGISTPNKLRWQLDTDSDQESLAVPRVTRWLR